MDSPAWTVLRGLCRGLHLAGYFCVFGTALFGAVLGRPLGLRRLAWGGFVLALLSGMAWFWLQSADFTGTGGFAAVLASLPLVAGYTRFGWLTLTRMGVLLLAMLCVQRRLWGLAAGFSGIGVLAQSWLGHGAAMAGGEEGDVLLAASLLHIGAAAAWLGTLPALALGLRADDEPLFLARRYSRLGMGCVAVLLATAFLQYLLLIGKISAFVTTFYGAAALVKLALFVGLIGLATRNRYRLAPALPASRRALLCAVLLEISLGVAVLMAAGVLMQLPPPAMAAMGG